MMALLVAAACTIDRAARPARAQGAALDAPHAAAIADSVRAFARVVAQGVSRDGPAAWRAYFLDGPAFFMASEGHLVFPSSDAATRGIRDLTQRIVSIELRWEDSVRVDPLAPGLAMMAAPYSERRVDRAGRRVTEAGFFTGLAEHGTGGWQFRDAHWSVSGSPSSVP